MVVATHASHPACLPGSCARVPCRLCIAPGLLGALFPFPAVKDGSAASTDLAQCSQGLPPVGVFASSFLAGSGGQMGLDRLAGASEGVQVLG